MVTANIYNRPFFWLLIGFIIGIGILTGNYPILVILFSGSVFTYIILRKPEIALIAIIIGSSSVFHYAVLQIPIVGGYEIAIHEAIVMLLFFILALRMVLDRDIRLMKSPVNLPMLFFLSMVVVSSLRSIFHFQISPSLVFWDARSLFQYSLFFLVPYAVRNKKDVKILITALFVIATVVSIMMLVQFFVGSDTTFFFEREGLEMVTSLGSQVGARIIPPGDSLIFVMLLVSLSLLGTTAPDSSKKAYLFLALVFGLGLLMTFTRAGWVSAIIGFAIICLFAKRAARRTLISFAVVGLIILIFFGLFVETYSVYITDKEMNFLGIVYERFMSVLKPESYQTGTGNTFETRTYEFTEAAPYIKAHPLLGIGFHNPYRLRWSVDGYYGYHFVHNAYLLLLLKMGLMGLVAYFWLSMAFLKRCISIYRNTDEPYLKGIVLASFVSYIAILIFNNTSPLLWHYSMVPCIALMMGLPDAISDMSKAA